MTMSPVSLWWNAIVQRLFGSSQELAAKMESRRGSFRLVIRYHPNLILVGKSLEEPIMGKHFKILQPARPHDHPVFDTTLLYIPIYCHLVLHPPSEIVRPKTPDLLIKARMEKVMDTWAD
uniref:WD repeat-containing protein on Y chromosome n=1 Tax=Culex pipiens TaxID=7175 RepID=A0A8D8CRQ3_CULPI